MQRVNLFHISRDNLHMLYKWETNSFKVHTRDGGGTVENSSSLWKNTTWKISCVLTATRWSSLDFYPLLSSLNQKRQEDASTMKLFMFLCKPFWDMIWCLQRGISIAACYWNMWFPLFSSKSQFTDVNEASKYIFS